MGRVWAIVKSAVIAFYDDQMTQHAAALTYYTLMSIFPVILLALSLLAILGQYPETYNSVIGYLRDVAPESVVAPLDTSLRHALHDQGTATSALALSVAVVLYGATGALEATRRALNVVFELKSGAGRSFLRRKAIDTGSTVLLLVLVVASVVLIFVGGPFADDLLGRIGLGDTGTEIWSIVRWPAGIVTAMLVFGFLYYVTPDVPHRSFRRLTPGAVVGVLLWLLASLGFSTYISDIANVGAIYGAFAGAIVLVGWLWLTNVALLFGAELNAAIGRQASS
jgi:membrane protein